MVFLYAQAHPDQVAGFVSINPSPPYKTWLRRARTVQTEAEIRKFELPWPRGDNDEGIDTRSDESMLRDPLPADLPYAVMFDAYCEELPPPLQNKQDCARMLRLLELTAKDLANVGKGGACPGQAGWPRHPVHQARGRPGHGRSGLEEGRWPITISTPA